MSERMHWILDLGSWNWTEEKLESGCLSRSVVYQEPSQRLLLATEGPGRCVLRIRCLRCAGGLVVGQVMRTEEGLLALSRVKRPNQFSLEHERSKQRPKKVPAEVVAVPYFLDEVEEVVFVCPRCWVRPLVPARDCGP